MTRELNSLSPVEPAPRPVRRRVGVGVVIAIAAIVGWAAFKHAAIGGLSNSEMSEGMRALSVAIDVGDAELYAAAEDHFVDAASVSVTDRYPAFVIYAARLIQQPSGDGPGVPVAAAIAKRDDASIASELENLERSNPEAAKLWRRLVGELRAAGGLSAE